MSLEKTFKTAIALLVLPLNMWLSFIFFDTFSLIYTQGLWEVMRRATIYLKWSLSVDSPYFHYGMTVVILVGIFALLWLATSGKLSKFFYNMAFYLALFIATAPEFYHNIIAPFL